MEKKRQSTKSIILATSALGLLIASTARIAGLFGTSVQAHAQATDSQNATRNVALAASPAFRDGLYVGRITSEHGSKPHISVGRWASEEDRAAYAAGYLQGYNEPVASAPSSHLGG